MSFAKATLPIPVELTKNETLVLSHVCRYGLTVSTVWAIANEFDGLDRVAVGAAVRRLTKLRLIERGVLHHGKFYFVPTHAGFEKLGKSPSSVGLMSEAAKLKAFARLMVCCREKPSFKLANSAVLIPRLGDSYRGIANRFLVSATDGQRLGYLNIDAHLASQPSRPAQQMRADILRFAKQPILATFMKDRCFEYFFVTVSKGRSEAVMKKFMPYKRVGKFPISVVVLPELMPLIAGISIGQEVFQTEHQC